MGALVCNKDELVAQNAEIEEKMKTLASLRSTLGKSTTDIENSWNDLQSKYKSYYEIYNSVVTGGFFTITNPCAAVEAGKTVLNSLYLAGSLYQPLTGSNPIKPPAISPTITSQFFGSVFKIALMGVVVYFGYKLLDKHVFSSSHGNIIPKSNLPRYAGGKRRR